jgi:N-acyl-D-amino-acid deacylase
LGLPLISKAARRYPEHRKCFSCHHQTLPLVVMQSARRTGLTIDDSLIAAQVEHTRNSFKKQLPELRAGSGIGGKGLTVGYGLLTFEVTKSPSDEITEAMVSYLLKTQHADGYWELHASRPPMEDSLESCAAIAAAGLMKYATAQQKAEAEQACAKTKAWLAARRPKLQEDRLGRLWGLSLLKAEDELIEGARQAVLASQRDDGGWSQVDCMESDAYATGMTLYVLAATGSKWDQPASRRGLEFLLATQWLDGSWYVPTRAKPVQVYFDNGDPHHKDQFISTPATCWALAAIAASLGKGG